MKKFVCNKCGYATVHIHSDKIGVENEWKTVRANGEKDQFGFYTSYSSEHVNCGGRAQYKEVSNE